MRAISRKTRRQPHLQRARLLLNAEPGAGHVPAQLRCGLPPLRGPGERPALLLGTPRNAARRAAPLARRTTPLLEHPVTPHGPRLPGALVVPELPGLAVLAPRPRSAAHPGEVRGQPGERAHLAGAPEESRRI